jgi:membrane fusion protein (multidrug efflux system)
MDARVDISQTGGRMLADAAGSSSSAATSVFDQDNTAADAEVRRIILANGVRPSKPARPLAGSAAPTRLARVVQVRGSASARLQ